MTETSDNLRIIDYRDELREHFEALNREWLEAHFRVEPIDVEYFADPRGTILDQGGEIYFAELDGRIVGTASLLCEEEPPELSKMAVTGEARGQGIGERLARHAIDRARQRGFDKVRLVTNAELVPAIRLYEKLGFETVSRGPDGKYDRGGLAMELDVGER